jgi:hypothetical protein
LQAASKGYTISTGTGTAGADAGESSEERPVIGVNLLGQYTEKGQYMEVFIFDLGFVSVTLQYCEGIVHLTLSLKPDSH